VFPGVGRNVGGTSASLIGAAAGVLPPCSCHGRFGYWGSTYIPYWFNLSDLYWIWLVSYHTRHATLAVEKSRGTLHQPRFIFGRGSSDYFCSSSIWYQCSKTCSRVLNPLQHHYRACFKVVGADLVFLVQASSVVRGGNEPGGVFRPIGTAEGGGQQQLPIWTGVWLAWHVLKSSVEVFRGWRRTWVCMARVFFLFCRAGRLFYFASAIRIPGYVPLPSS